MQIPDIHIHPDFSFDAHGSIAQYAQAASTMGLEEICFTTHLDLDPVRKEADGWVNVNGDRFPNDNPAWLVPYLEQIEQARYQTSGLRIKSGLEIDFFPDVEGLLAPFLSAYPWDYLLGSVHCLEHLAVAEHSQGRAYLSRHTPAEVASATVEQTLAAIRSGKFTAIAHLDYLKRLDVPGFRQSYQTALADRLEEVFRALVETETAMEINTRAINTYQLGEPFPGRDALQQAFRCGVRQITFGSDSHRPEELANSFLQAKEFAIQAGFVSVTTYQGGKIERIVPLQ